LTWINLQLDQAPDRIQGIPKQKPGSFDGTKQVGHHRETATFDTSEQQGGAACLINSPLNLGGFEARIDLGIDPDEMMMPFEIENSFLKAAITHNTRGLVCIFSELADITLEPGQFNVKSSPGSGPHNFGIGRLKSQ
jgi:hypothetical protein